MNSFFDFILRIMNVMWELLSISKNTIKNKFLIYIKTNAGGTVPVNLDPKWDIKTLKKTIAPKLGLEPQEVKIILAGKELCDATIIEDCDLGEQSILHAVKVNISPKKDTENNLIEDEQSGSKPLCETLLDFELQSGNNSENINHIEKGQLNEPSFLPNRDKFRKFLMEAFESLGEKRKDLKAHFYVFCSTCKSLKTGKLRVRCHSCKSGAFTVHDDPQSWDDVLLPKRITGNCENIEEICASVHQNDEPSFAEFYFKCSEHKSQGENDQAVPLDLIRPNLREIICLACTEVCDPVFVYTCAKDHVTCLDCFRQYCASRLQERQFIHDADFGYTLSCPIGCENSLIKEIHHFRLMTDAQYTQYQRFATEEFVLQNGGVLCPQPNCGMGIFADDGCNKIACTSCSFVFCRLCLQGFHIGECRSTDSLDRNNQSCLYLPPASHYAEAKWEEATKVTIKISTKPCPKCRTPTERDGGCMHMVCTRAGCGFHWCWVCQTEWTRDCMGSHWFG